MATINLHSVIEKSAPTKRILPFPLIILLLINLLVAISTGISFSISPFLLTESLGLSIFLFGCIEGFCELLANLMKLVSGRMVDRFRKKQIVLYIGLLLALLSRPFLYFGKSAWTIFTSKALERLSNGFIAPSRDVLAAKLSPKDNLGTAYGFVMGSKTLGCVLGSFMLSALSCVAPAIFLGNYPLFILISAFCSAGALGMGLFLQSETSKPSNDQGIQENSTESTIEQNFRLKDVLDLGETYWSLLLCAVFFMLGRFNDGLLIVYLKGAGVPPAMYLSTVGIYNSISLLSAYPIGQLMDAGKTKLAIWITLLSLILFNLCFLNSMNSYILFIGITLWGVQRSSSQIVFVSAISRSVPLHRLGTALGLYYMASGFMSFIAATIASSLAHYSYPLIFSLSIGASAVALILIPKKATLQSLNTRKDVIIP